MILTYAQITEVLQCPDCARRRVDVKTFPSVPAALESLGICSHYLQTCDDPECERCTVRLHQPVNLVWVRHDPGCPRLGDYIQGKPQDAEELMMYAVDIELDEDHTWARKLGLTG